MSLSKAHTFFLLVFFLIFLSLLSFQIEKLNSNNSQPKDPLYRLLGSVKEVFGDTAFLKADSYFHGGVSRELLKRRIEDHGAEHDDEEDEAAFKNPSTDWIYKINSRIKVTEHRHLKGMEVKEMLPFLFLSTRLDPYNVPAILTAAHWIERNFNKTDEAIEILKKGATDNPEAWQIFSALGLIYLEKKNDLSESAGYFERAVARMDEKNSEKYDLRLVWYSLAESYSKQGLKDKALLTYRKTLEFFDEENLPLKRVILEKISALS